MPKINPQSSERAVVFEVTTLKPLPVGQQVFIAGNQPMIGAWHPDGFPLTRMDDNTWAASAILPVGEPLEFKVTRGTWDTEAVAEDGSLLPNTTADITINPRVVATVKRWHDEA